MKSVVRTNAEKDPSYCPYCLRCRGLVRMLHVPHTRFYWRCGCGAECDARLYHCVVRDVRDGRLHPFRALGVAGLDELLLAMRGFLKQTRAVTGKTIELQVALYIEGEAT